MLALEIIEIEIVLGYSNCIRHNKNNSSIISNIVPSSVRYTFIDFKSNSLFSSILLLW